MKMWSTGYEDDEPTDVRGNLQIVGDLQINGSTIIFSKSELALIDILPQIKETHPHLYLKYIELIPEKESNEN